MVAVLLIHPRVSKAVAPVVSALKAKSKSAVEAAVTEEVPSAQFSE